MMNKILIFVLFSIIAISCSESIEKRAEREAREYTEKYCPTPVVNYTRTDSVVFFTESKTYVYYCSFTDKMDDESIISENKMALTNALKSSISESTELKTYKDAGFSFAYICHSANRPEKVLFEVIFHPKDYK